MREKSVIFNESQLEEIEACLDELARNTDAQEILLANVKGQLISARGRFGGKATTATGIAALSAGGYAAMVEMARYFEIDTEFKQISYESEHHSIYSSNVDNALIITVVFDHNVKLGIVRAFTNQAAQCLQNIADRARVEMARDDDSELDRLSRERELDAEFSQALVEELETFLT